MSSADLVHRKGLGLALLSSTYCLLACSRWRAERRVPRRMYFSVSVAKPALDLIEPGCRGGHEVHVESPMTREPIPDRGRLVGAVVVHHEMHVQPAGYVGLHGAQELQEFAAAMAAVEFADHLPGGDFQCREQGRGAMAHVVVRSALGDARGQRQDGLRAIWLFSSTHRTMAFRGGARYRPTMSRTFSTNSGSASLSTSSVLGLPLIATSSC